MKNPYASNKWRPSDRMGRLKAGGDYRKEVIDGIESIRIRRVMPRVALVVARKAWEEGKAEQAEIVSGLVRACKIALEVIDAEGTNSWPWSRGVIEQAIAKAKGGD